MACVSTCAVAYPSLTWDAIVLKSRTDSHFKKAVLDAVKVRLGEAIKRFSQQDVCRDLTLGSVIEKEYRAPLGELL